MEPKVRVVQLAVMFGLIALIYAQTLGFGAMLNFDDHLYFMSRALVEDWWGATWSDRLLTPDVGYPNPGPTAVYALVRSLPSDWILPGVHAASVVMFGLAAAALCGVAGAVSKKPWLGWAVAMVWCAHPLMVESVAWLTNLKTVMYGVGYGATVWAWWRYLESEGKRGWLVAVALGGLWALSSRPSGVTLPAVMAALAWCRGGWGEVRSARVLAPVVLGGVLALAYVPIAVSNHDALITSSENTETGFASMGMRLERMGGAAWIQMTHLMWPAGLDPIYDAFAERPVWQVAFGWVALVAWVLGAAWGLVVKRTPWGLGLALGLVAYAPASNITYLPRFTADTYAFLPTFWLVFALATWLAGRLEGLEDAALEKAKLYVVMGASLLVVTLSGVSYLQTMRWSSELSLWRDMVERETTAPQPYFLYGIALAEVGEYERSVAVFEANWGELFRRGYMTPAFPMALDRSGRTQDAFSASRAMWASPLNTPPNLSCEVVYYGAKVGAGDAEAFGQCLSSPSLSVEQLDAITPLFSPERAAALRAAHAPR